MAFHVRVKYTSINKMRRTFMRNSKSVRREFAEWVIKKTDPYVPADTLELARSARVQGDGSIIYDTPYAHRLYEGYIGKSEPWMATNEGRKFMAQRRLEQEAGVLDTQEFFVFSDAVHPKAQSHWFYGAAMDQMEEYEAKMAELILQEARKGR